MSQSSVGFKGRLWLRVRSARGDLVAERRAQNLVLRQGAALVAQLFAGVTGTPPINQVQMGFGHETADVEAKALTPPDAALNIPPEALRSPVVPTDFTIDTTKPDTIVVSVASVFRPTIELKDVSEAGLLSGSLLYNQVVFEPVTLRVGQNVTFFWEIDFPFGR